MPDLYKPGPEWSVRFLLRTLNSMGIKTYDLRRNDYGKDIVEFLRRICR